MGKHTIRINGQEISSGDQGAAIAGVRLTKSLCDGRSFQVGAVCPALLEVTLLDVQPPQPGTKLELLDENGALLGIFYCQQAKNQNGRMELTAYDSLLNLEKDVSAYLQGLTQWPYSLEDFCHGICTYCGVTLDQAPLTNGDYPVEKFSAQGITGREIMGFAGEIVGGCLVDCGGVAQFHRYAQKALALTPGGENYCFSIQLEDYDTPAFDKVQFRKTDTDVGAVYPDIEGENVYIVQGNPLVTQAEALAQSLFSQVQGISYTPGQVTVPESCPAQLGDVITVKGKTFYVMEAVAEQGLRRLSCYGSAQPTAAPARNTRKLESLKGKVLELSMQVEGLKAENRDMQGNLSSLALDISAISTKVTAQVGEHQNVQEKLTQLSQTATALSATVKTIQNQGTSRVENAFGVTLDGSCFTIARSDSEMVNRLDETGMYVLRGGGEVMLQANAAGVTATDVSVRNYLKVGDHARFEDYGTNRTACYYC